MRTYPQDYPAQSPMTYGADAPVVKSFYLDLSIARDKVRMSFGGRFLWAYRGSDATCTVDIQLNDNQRDAITFTRGMQWAGIPFSNLFVTNTAQAGAWLTFIITDARPEVLNPELTLSSIAGTVSLTKATTGASVADQTVVAAAASAVILAASATRRSVIISSPSANTQEVRIGIGGASAAATGIPLQPGEHISLECTVALYAYTGAGADQKLAVSYTAD